MKKLYALCLVTLMALAADVLYFHASPVSAKTQTSIGKVTIHAAAFFQKGDGNFVSQTIDVADSKVLSFQCVPATAPNDRPVCFIATGN
jgi:hypothetical protein